MMCKKCQSNNLDNRSICWYCDTPLLPIETSSAIASTSLGMGSDNQRHIATNTAIKHNFDLHDFAYSFTITSRHYFSKGLEKRMNNWAWHLLETDRYKIAVKPKVLEIFVKKRFFTSQAEITEAKIEKEVKEFAINFARENALQIIETPVPIRKEVKIVDYRVAENFRTANFKSVYPAPSPLEFTNPKKAVKDSIQFITKVDQIEDALHKWSIEYSKHAQVLASMDLTMININKSLSAITKVAIRPSLIEKIKGWFIRKNTEYLGLD